MPNDLLPTTPDRATVERLSTAFSRCFETFDAGEDVFAADAFFDLYPPFWRFQLQGRDAFLAQQRAIADDRERSARILRMVPTSTGFVLEDEQAVHGPKAEVARHLWLCEVRDARITRVVGYCNGGWDDELRARHSVEAPMLRP